MWAASHNQFYGIFFCPVQWLPPLTLSQTGREGWGHIIAIGTIVNAKCPNCDHVNTAMDVSSRIGCKSLFSVPSQLNSW